MSQDLRIEDGEGGSFTTSRTVNSKLWMQNNAKLTEQVLANLAKCQQRHGVVLYGFIIMSNHYHMLAAYPRCNRAAFKRDFNSSFARLVKRHVSEFEGGSLFGRRFRPQAVIRDEDFEQAFIYTALNPVSSGLVEEVSEYPGYNSYMDAIKGVEKEFTILNHRDFNDRSRYNKGLNPEDFSEKFTLKYSRLQVYDGLSQQEYEQTILEKIRNRQKEIVTERKKQGQGFAGVKSLKKTKPGASPKSTKTSDRNSKRPLILTSCIKTKKKFLDKYFTIRAMFTEAYFALKEGAKNILFPKGTYHPPLLWVCS